MSRGESSLIRAAASSSASGSPSRRTQSSATASAFSSESSKSGLASRARSTKSRTASMRRSRSTSSGTRRVGKLERGDGVDPLLGDVERRAAGDEERQTRAHPRAARRARRRVEQLLEVVEHEQRSPAAQGGDQRSRAIRVPAVSIRPSASAIVVATRSASLIGASSTSTTPSGNSSSEVCCRPRPRDASSPSRPVRSASGGAHPPFLSSPRISLCSRLRPTNEVDRARRPRLTAGDASVLTARRRPAPDPDRGSRARGCAAPTPGSIPSCLDQRLPRRPVGVQSLRLPARAVEREHELAAQALRQRVLGDQTLELADELAVPAEGEIRVDAILERGEVKLRQPADLALSPRLVGELGEGRAAPEPRASRRLCAAAGGSARARPVTRRSKRCRSRPPGSTRSS